MKQHAEAYEELIYSLRKDPNAIQEATYGRGYTMKIRSCEPYTGCVTLYHYGTAIFKWDPETKRVTTGGYSCSDRDSINAMLRLLRLPGCATRRGGRLRIEY